MAFYSSPIIFTGTALNEVNSVLKSDLCLWLQVIRFFPAGLFGDVVVVVCPTIRGLVLCPHLLYTLIHRWTRRVCRMVFLITFAYTHCMENRRNNTHSIFHIIIFALYKLYFSKSRYDLYKLHQYQCEPYFIWTFTLFHIICIDF